MASHNSLFRLSGSINAACLHCVPVERSEHRADELRFSVTVRAAKRLLVNALLNEYKLFASGAWITCCLPAPSSGAAGEKRKVPKKLKQESEQGLDDSGTKAQLAQLPAARLARKRPRGESAPAMTSAGPCWQRILAQILDGPPTCYDLTALEGGGADCAPSNTPEEPERKRAARGQGHPKAATSAPAPKPEKLEIDKVLGVKCPKLSLSMLGANKLVENRDQSLRLGWHAVYTLLCRDRKGLEEFGTLIDALPYSDADMEKYYGHVCGFIFIASIRSPEDCNGYPWAKKGQHCHVIMHSITLTEPVPIEKPQNPGSRWSIKSQDERQRILAQIPDGSPTCHDLAALGGGKADSARSSSA